ncbi:hypothetical protein NDN08_003797 [Rhodosorus marinus]|uniref:EF-hand domain-containing protein n=1 Tax=Rhodosorus marinus TaxID=101924 RepID=A0AAV8UGI4_9RHOD|nr:hypothetical protein NDN08_003797 [Rhodosorus marinus]
MSESSALLSGQPEISKAYGANLIKSFAKVSMPPERGSPADRIPWLKPLAFSVLFIFVGVAFFMARFGWSFSKALYFCIVTITTVGYGDFYPLDSASKLFIVAYVICAISAIATYLSGVVEGVIEKQAEHLTNVLSRRFDGEQGKEEPEEGVFSEALQSLAFFALVFVIGLGFFVFDQKKSLVDALYVTTISSSTVGYGDLTIEPTARAELFTSVWLVFSTIGLAKVIGDFSAAFAAKNQQRFIDSVLESALTSTGDFRQMDSDQDGRITKAEFLVSMLERMDLVQKNDLDEILGRFDELDLDGSGYVDRSEVVKLDS